MKHAGHEAIEAGNGRQRLALYEWHRPEAVICDILMPEVDRLETTQASGAVKTLETPFDRAALFPAVADVLGPIA